MRQMQLGEHVTFWDHNRLPKAAIVTGNRQSIDPRQVGNGGQVPRIESDDELHLTVFPPTGGLEVRHNIRRGKDPGCWEPADQRGGSG
jgi:hypothetical protein